MIILDIFINIRGKDILTEYINGTIAIKEPRLFEFNLKGLDSRELINAWQIHAPTHQIRIIQLATEET